MLSKATKARMQARRWRRSVPQWRRDRDWYASAVYNGPKLALNSFCRGLPVPKHDVEQAVLTKHVKLQGGKSVVSSKVDTNRTVALDPNFNLPDGHVDNYVLRHFVDIPPVWRETPLPDNHELATTKDLAVVDRYSANVGSLWDQRVAANIDARQIRSMDRNQWRTFIGGRSPLLVMLNQRIGRRELIRQALLVSTDVRGKIRRF